MTISVFGSRIARAPAGFAAVLAAVALASCATGGVDPALKESPNYIVGWSDGCETAREREKSFGYNAKIRDDSKFEQDEAYRVGWRQGYLECQTRSPSEPPDAFHGERADGTR